MNKQQLTKQYYDSKKKLLDMRDDITLKRWKVLSKAYKLGKQVWGSRFTRERLAEDMDTPYTTVLRCLSLDRVNKRNWKLINEGKISVYKVAQICQSKNLTYQDEIVDMVIKENYSTYQIKSLKIGGLKDISKEKQRIATENGYSRKYSAYLYFNGWIERGDNFLLMDKNNLPEKKIKEIEKKLKSLVDNIDKYLKTENKHNANRSVE